MIRDVNGSTRPQRQHRDPVSRAAGNPRAHLAALRDLPELLEELGVPSGPILEAVGLKREDFEDPAHTASFAELDQLLGTCVRRTKCTHFGLLLGRNVNLHSFGIAGRLARNAANVGTALQELAAFFVLHDGGGTPSVAVHDGRATFSYGIHAANVRHSDQIYDLAVAGLLNVMRQVCGADWRPIEILLPRKRPADVRPYREILGWPLRFNSMQAALVFPAKWLERPVLDADPLLHTLLEDRASVDLAQLEPVLGTDVRRLVRIMLLEGRSSRAELAARLGLHPRTMGRRLQQTGTTFQALLDDARLQLARQLLHDTRSTVSRISGSLGYRDPAVFSRAFRRWTGLTPREFRASLAEDR